MPEKKSNAVFDPAFFEANHEVVTVRTITPIKARPFYATVKRLFDILVSFTAILVLLLPMLIIALCVALDSRGPVIYRQERLGKNGKPFHILKFRSMRADAEAGGARWTSREDERVTRVGRFLRRSHLDELPQLFNIISGQMSFVGPRPERPCFHEVFCRYIRGFEQRLLVTPGLTGLAQVSGGYDLLPEEKIVYDLDYVERRSVGLDLACLFRTFGAVFGGKGAR